MERDYPRSTRVGIGVNYGSREQSSRSPGRALSLLRSGVALLQGLRLLALPDERLRLWIAPRSHSSPGETIAGASQWTRRELAPRGPETSSVPTRAETAASGYKQPRILSASEAESAAAAWLHRGSARGQHAATDTGVRSPKRPNCGRSATDRSRPQLPRRLSEYGVTSSIEGSNPSLSVRSPKV